MLFRWVICPLISALFAALSIREMFRPDPTFYLPFHKVNRYWVDHRHNWEQINRIRFDLAKVKPPRSVLYLYIDSELTHYTTVVAVGNLTSIAQGFHEMFVVEDNGRSRDFYDEVDHTNYYHVYDKAEKFFQDKDAGKHKGRLYKVIKIIMYYWNTPELSP